MTVMTRLRGAGNGSEKGDGQKTHRLIVVDPRDGAQVEPLLWNGKVEDQAAARAVFEARMATGMFAAYKSTVEAPGKPAQHTQIFAGEFDVEADQILLTPAISGGDA